MIRKIRFQNKKKSATRMRNASFSILIETKRKKIQKLLAKGNFHPKHFDRLGVSRDGLIETGANDVKPPSLGTLRGEVALTARGGGG